MVSLSAPAIFLQLLLIAWLRGINSLYHTIYYMRQHRKYHSVQHVMQRHIYHVLHCWVYLWTCFLEGLPFNWMHPTLWLKPMHWMQNKWGKTLTLGENIRAAGAKASGRGVMGWWGESTPKYIHFIVYSRPPHCCWPSPGTTLITICASHMDSLVSFIFELACTATLATLSFRSSVTKDCC